jgi:hypothetical protein
MFCFVLAGKNWFRQNKYNNLPVLGNNKFHWGWVIRFFVLRSTTQWPKEKVQKEKQRSTKHTHKTKDRVTQPNNQILLATSLWFPEFKQLQGTKYETRPIPKIQWIKKLLCHPYWHYFTTKIMSICPIWNLTLYVTQSLHFFENHPKMFFKKDYRIINVLVKYIFWSIMHSIIWMKFINLCREY